MNKPEEERVIYQLKIVDQRIEELRKIVNHIHKINTYEKRSIIKIY